MDAVETRRSSTYLYLFSGATTVLLAALANDECHFTKDRDRHYSRYL